MEEWAGSLFHAAGRGKSLSTTPRIVCSYDTPIAMSTEIEGAWVVLLSPTRHTMCTSRHQAIVRSVIGKLNHVALFEVPVLDPTNCDGGHDANIAYMMAKVAEERQRCAKARTPETRAHYLARAELIKAKCAQYKEVFQLDRSNDEKE